MRKAFYAVLILLAAMFGFCGSWKGVLLVLFAAAVIAAVRAWRLSWPGAGPETTGDPDAPAPQAAADA